MHRSVSVKSDGCQWETGSVKIFIINNRHLIELYTLTDQGEEQGHSGSIQQYQCNSGPGPDGIKNIRSHCPTFLGWDDCSKIVLNCATFHFLFLVEKKICGWFLEPLNEDPVNGIEQHATFQRHRTVFLAHSLPWSFEWKICVSIRGRAHATFQVHKHYWCGRTICISSSVSS